MVCAGLNASIEYTIGSLLAFPTTCDYYFYAKIMAGLFIILSLLLFFHDKDRLGRGDMISSLGVSAMAIIFISFIGTLFQIIQRDVMIEILVIGLIFISLWLFKR